MTSRALWTSLFAPTIADIQALAESAWVRMPDTFRNHLGGLAILVEDFPDDETLAELGIESPFDLLGLYRGIDLTRRSVSDVSVEPTMIFLYRRPLLDAWAEGENTLGALVTHVLVHEIGHHFGLSDEAMEAIEDAAQPLP